MSKVSTEERFVLTRLIRVDLTVGVLDLGRIVRDLVDIPQISTETYRRQD
jgi:hypothetical protein